MSPQYVFELYYNYIAGLHCWTIAGPRSKSCRNRFHKLADLVLILHWGIFHLMRDRLAQGYPNKHESRPIVPAA